MPRAAGLLQPGQDPLGKAGLVPAVARQDDVDVGRGVVEHVTTDDADALSVRPGVERDRRDRERIDVRRGHGLRHRPASRR